MFALTLAYHLTLVDTTLTLISTAICRIFDMTSCSGHSFLSFDIVKPYLAYDCITMGRYDIHDLCMILTFGLD